MEITPTYLLLFKYHRDRDYGTSVLVMRCRKWHVLSMHKRPVSVYMSYDW
jgi:hypothetical protein